MQIDRYVRGTLSGPPGNQVIVVQESELAGLPAGSRVGILTAVLPLAIAVYYGAEKLIGSTDEEKAAECLKAGGKYDVDTEECTKIGCPDGFGFDPDSQTCVPLPPKCGPGTHLVMGPGGAADMKCVADAAGTGGAGGTGGGTGGTGGGTTTTVNVAPKEEPKKSYLPWILLGTVVVAGVGGAIWYSSKKKLAGAGGARGAGH